LQPHRDPSRNLLFGLETKTGTRNWSLRTTFSTGPHPAGGTGPSIVCPRQPIVNCYRYWAHCKALIAWRGKHLYGPGRLGVGFDADGGEAAAVAVDYHAALHPAGSTTGRHQEEHRPTYFPAHVAALLQIQHYQGSIDRRCTHRYQQVPRRSPACGYSPLFITSDEPERHHLRGVSLRSHDLPAPGKAPHRRCP
jgi:hypothetical protein